MASGHGLAACTPAQHTRLERTDWLAARQAWQASRGQPLILLPQPHTSDAAAMSSAVPSCSQLKQQFLMAPLQPRRRSSLLLRSYTQGGKSAGGLAQQPLSAGKHNRASANNRAGISTPTHASPGQGKAGRPTCDASVCSSPRPGWSSRRLPAGKRVTLGSTVAMCSNASADSAATPHKAHHWRELSGGPAPGTKQHDAAPRWSQLEGWLWRQHCQTHART